MLNSTTIVIPTFNRPKFLENLILYLSEFKITSPVIVADGSNKKNIILNKKLIRKYNQKNNNQIYHYEDNSFFVERIYNALKLVKTNFCKINSDDDYFSKSYIINSAIGLNKNKSYVAFTGYQISYQGKEKYNFAAADEILNKDPYNRIKFAKNNWHIWSVYRTKELKLIFSRAINSMPRSISQKNELNHWIKIKILGFYMRSYTALLGKVKNSRCCENITVYHQKNWARKHNFLISDIFSNIGFNFFFKKILFYVCKDFNLSTANATGIVMLTLFSDKQVYKKKNILFKIVNKLQYLLDRSNFWNNYYLNFLLNKKLDSKEAQNIINYINSRA